MGKRNLEMAVYGVICFSLGFLGMKKSLETTGLYILEVDLYLELVNHHSPVADVFLFLLFEKQKHSGLNSGQSKF